MKIGIITMHKVLNYGSALQAYALQQKLLSMGYDNELIDYEYPHPVKNVRTIKTIFHKIVVFLRNAVIGFPTERKKKRFSKFYKQNFNLSGEFYTEESIRQNPPIYDAYITGSDQVWNPRFAGNDSNFFLDFVPAGKLKFSYASSFAVENIDDDFVEKYSKLLSDYREISVRERTGINIIRKLTQKDSVVCCDPTLLLNSNEWGKIAAQTKFKTKDKYILVYILNYMVGDIYDDVQRITEYVQHVLNLKVIYLIGRKEDAFRPNSILYKSGGPSEFVWLFQNADFVITSSFHGAAFSLIFDRPLFGVVDTQNKSDSRIQSLLEMGGVSSAVIDYRSTPDFNKNELLNLKGNKELLKEYRELSMAYLDKILKMI